MSKAIIDESTLTNLADKIRVLNGTENTMTPDEMNSGLTSANDEVDAQSALIDQLSEMLEGKAAGGGSGGEILNETCILTNNSTYLDSITTSDGTVLASPFNIGDTIDLSKYIGDYIQFKFSYGTSFDIVDDNGVAVPVSEYSDTNTFIVTPSNVYYCYFVVPKYNITLQ